MKGALLEGQEVLKEEEGQQELKEEEGQQELKEEAVVVGKALQELYRRLHLHPQIPHQQGQRAQSLHSCSTYSCTSTVCRS